MSDEVFYPKLVQGLMEQDYRCRAQDLATPKARADKDALTSGVRLITKVVPAVLKAVAHVHMLPGGFDIHPYFDQEGIQKILDDIKMFSVWIGLKFVLDQPVLIAVIDADHHTDEENVEIAAAFDKLILQMLDYSATMGGLNIAGIQIGGVKFSSTGILLYSFAAHDAAVHFETTVQNRCKITHFWKKTNVLPWVVDAAAREIKGHPGLPFLGPAILSRDKLAHALTTP